MKHQAIEQYFAISLFVGLPLGLVLMFFWARKIFGPLMRSIRKDRAIQVQSIAMKATFFSLPGLLAMILCSLPSIYFSHQLKQFDYCVQLVEVNKGITRDDPDVVERCGNFDFDELSAQGS